LTTGDFGECMYVTKMKRQGIGEKFHNGLQNVYFSPNIIKIIKSKTIRLAGNVACSGKTSSYKILIGKS
jgi:hypothetical protein